MFDLSKTPVAIERLGAVAEVLPGFSTGGRLEHDADGARQVVLSKHLTPGLPYIFREEDTFRIKPNGPADRAIDERARDLARYELRPNDVLFMSRGIRNLATRIEHVPSGSIAPVSFFIIRLTPNLLGGRVDPRYLAWYLNSPRAQTDIANVRTGAATPIVQRAPFQDLAIPLPDLETQRRIGALGETMAHERSLHERLAVAIQRGHDATSNTIAARLFALGERLGDTE